MGVPVVASDLPSGLEMVQDAAVGEAENGEAVDKTDMSGCFDSRSYSCQPKARRTALRRRLRLPGCVQTHRRTFIA